MLAHEVAGLDMPLHEESYDGQEHERHGQAQHLFTLITNSRANEILTIREEN